MISMLTLTRGLRSAVRTRSVCTAVKPRVVVGLDGIESLVGAEVGKSSWCTVTQEMIDTFAAATGDHQWIHVDVERCQRESPFGTTIAHGFLSLSLVPRFANEIMELRGVDRQLNYGLNRVRFPNPVAPGARLRGVHSIISAERIESGALQYINNFVVEIEGAAKPACVAESIVVAFE